MAALPWMPLYVAEYLADTGHLSTVEHGAYMLLIMHYWQNEGLPADEARLARIARMTPAEWCEVRDTLADLFDEGWRHNRIDREIAAATETLAKRSAAGKRAASARYANRNADRMRSAVQTHAPKGSGKGQNLEASSTDQEEASPREGTTSEPMARLEFESAFWEHYPHKVGKSAALTAYVAARRKATLAEILDGLARYKSDKPPDRQWLNPATFLNQERWNDEPAPVDSSPRNANGNRPHDAIFRALAEAASDGSGPDGWEADADGRLLSDDGRAPPN